MKPHVGIVYLALALAFSAGIVLWPKRSVPAQTPSTERTSLRDECARRELRCSAIRTTETWHLYAETENGTGWYVTAESEGVGEEKLLKHLDDSPDWPGRLETFDINKPVWR